MKRILLTLIVAGGLALMAAAPAGAVANPLCKNNYAVLLTGANPLGISQTGTGDDPGALTNAVGVGVIHFGAAVGTGCGPSTGEMIYNDGDTQSSGDPGVFVGPAHCYDNFGLFESLALQNGIPCFDGGNHMTGITVGPSAFGNGASTLNFTISSAWLNGAATPSTNSFSFTVQASTLGATVVGTSVPPVSSTSRDLTKPILTLTMQKIGKTLGTAFGVAPFLGTSVVSVSSYGSNGSDLVSATLSANGFAGSYTSTVGAVQFFNATQGGGSVSINGNDGLQATAATATADTDCAFDITPGNNCTAIVNSHCTANSVPYLCCTGAGIGTCDCAPEPVTAAFTDGTANTVAIFNTSGLSCSLNSTNPGVGFSQSTVVWGSTDTNTYFMNTAFVSGATLGLQGGFTPGVGGSGVGTNYATTPAGKLTTSNTATQALTIATGSSISKVITLTNTSPADCQITATLAGGPLTDGNCTVSLANGSTDVTGDTVVNTTVGGAPTLTCACSPTIEDAGLNAGITLHVTSNNCPIATGGGSTAVTCNN